MHSEYYMGNDNKSWLKTEDMIYYEKHNISINSYKSMDEHYLKITLPNFEEIKYPILVDHYVVEAYEKYRNEIFNDVKMRMRKIKLESINKKLNR